MEDSNTQDPREVARRRVLKSALIAYLDELNRLLDVGVGEHNEGSEYRSAKEWLAELDPAEAAKHTEWVSSEEPPPPPGTVNHAVPTDGTTRLPCCGVDALELPREGWLVGDRAQVTCPGAVSLGTSGGVELTPEVVAGLVAEAEAGYDLDRLVPRPAAGQGKPDAIHWAVEYYDLTLGQSRLVEFLAREEPARKAARSGGLRLFRRGVWDNPDGSVTYGKWREAPVEAGSLDERDPVIGLTGREIAAAGEEAYDRRDDPAEWEDIPAPVIDVRRHDWQLPDRAGAVTRRCTVCRLWETPFTRSRPCGDPADLLDRPVEGGG